MISWSSYGDWNTKKRRSTSPVRNCYRRASLWCQGPKSLMNHGRVAANNYIKVRMSTILIRCVFHLMAKISSLQMISESTSGTWSRIRRCTTSWTWSRRASTTWMKSSPTANSTPQCPLSSSTPPPKGFSMFAISEKHHLSKTIHR